MTITPDLERRFFFLLDNSHMQISNAAEQILAQKTGLGRAQAAVLLYLGYNDGCSLSDIAKGVGRKNAAISGLIDRMTAANLLERQTAYGDRRARNVHLTAQGWLLRDTVIEDLKTFNRHLLKGLSNSEIEIVLKFLTQAVTNLEKIAPQKP